MNFSELLSSNMRRWGPRPRPSVMCLRRDRDLTRFARDQDISKQCFETETSCLLLPVTYDGFSLCWTSLDPMPWKTQQLSVMMQN